MIGDEARNKLAMKFALQEVEAGEQFLLLSHRVEHCQRIDRHFVKRGIPSGFFLGGAANRSQFELTRAGVKDGSIRVGVGTYKALGVGVNLPAVGAGMAVTPIAGNKFNFNQVRGRFNRKNKCKTKADMYYLWDRHVYPSHLKNIIAWNPSVKVFDKGRWVDAKAYLKAKNR
jgi:superfamily II DNA or RNA helicase